mgnify:FL=1|jgi:5-methylcytosine-specific restriction endonuclease McrA
MTKAQRREVYDKYGGRCAYCGKPIRYKDMQVDHIIPRRKGGRDEMSNYNPACRRCNHYKDSLGLEQFRGLIRTLPERLRKIYIFRVEEDYGIVRVQEWDGKFYFEKRDVK